jgi:ElaB/YqjD/DUF883 family membrane-anchored ribosome-binding protein
MTTAKIDGDLDSVREDLAKLREDVANLATSLKGATSEALHEQIDAARARIDRLSGEARQQSRQTLDDLTDKIEERPLASILVAFGVGILIGRLLDR